MRIVLLAGVAMLAACNPSPSAPSNDRGAAPDTAAADKQAPLGALVDPASPGSATEVATRYAAAVSEGRLGEAFGLVAPGSDAAGGGASAFVAHFRDRREIVMTIGEAGNPVDAKAQKLVEVPAVLSGVDRAGTPFRVEGPILLRVTDKSAMPDVPPHWQVVRTLFPA